MPFLDLAGRLRDVRDRIAAATRSGHAHTVTIVAVTKTHGADAVQAAWDAGLADVGENRVQEALPKMDALAVPVRWHLIGHLQRNKVKAVPRFHLLQSLDRASLADAINDVGRATGRPIDALMQVSVVGEETKGGFLRAEWQREADRMLAMAGLRIRGVMTMAPLDATERMLRTAFAGARDAAEVLRAAGHDATELSMGMSNDYEIAVEEGATCVRLGTILFGARSV